MSRSLLPPLKSNVALRCGPLLNGPPPQPQSVNFSCASTPQHSGGHTKGQHLTRPSLGARNARWRHLSLTSNSLSFRPTCRRSRQAIGSRPNDCAPLILAPLVPSSLAMLDACCETTCDPNENCHLRTLSFTLAASKLVPGTVGSAQTEK